MDLEVGFLEVYLHSTWKTPTVNPMHLTAATLSWQSSRCWCMGRMLGQFDPANRNLKVRNGTYGDSCQMSGGGGGWGGGGGVWGVGGGGGGGGHGVLAWSRALPLKVSQLL